MKMLLKSIRMECGMSQEEFAKAIGSTFASVNRWENGHHTPSRLAQRRIIELCGEKGISLSDLVLSNIATKAEVETDRDRMLLFHGSKSGITGQIAPISREHCDFGAGFYMGTNPLQPLTLICDFDESKFYAVSIPLKGLSTLEVPADLDWAFLVAFHRGRMEKVKGTALYNRFVRMTAESDLIIGSIANDRMFYVLDNFFLGNITDVALVQSLSALQLGKQYVAKTQNACNQVRIEREIPLSYLEKECLKSTSKINRDQGISLANDICKIHRREGRFFVEILDVA